MSKADIIVKKYGGSMLKSSHDYDKVVENIYADTKYFKQIIILSAPYLKTDSIIEKINTNGPTSENFQSLLLATGEQESLAEIGLRLERKKINTDYIFGTDLPLYTSEKLVNSTVTGVDIDKLESRLKNFDVILIAGFQGWNKEKEKITTLGRGGSDLTASMIATALKCPCYFYKDSGGIGLNFKQSYEKLYDKVNFEEILEFADHGAKVINDRAALIIAANKTQTYFGSLQHSKKTTVESIKTSRVDNITLSQQYIRLIAPLSSLKAVPKIQRFFHIITIDTSKNTLNLILKTKNNNSSIDSKSLSEIECLMLGSSSKIVGIDIIGSGLLENSHWYLKALCEKDHKIIKIIVSQFKVCILMTDINNEDTLAILHQLEQKLKSSSIVA